MIEQNNREPWGARVMRAFAVGSLLAVAAAPAAAQFCSNCIINSAAPQSAQFNVTSGTVRGILTVGTLNTSALTVSGTMAAALFSGSGASLTALSASNLASGTVPTARVAGAYTGITQVGTLAAGTWQGTVIAPAYGGTGANLSISGTAGGLPWFTGSGVQGVVTSPAGPRVLATAGSGAKPVWVSSPALTGENFSAIPLTALVNGTLQSGIQVTNDSLVSIDAAKVSGNIAGGADFLTTPLPISDLAAGTLPTTNAASSVTVTGTPIGTFGGPTTLAQFRVGGDGRLYDAKQFNLVVYSTQVVPGPLPAGVTIAADQISSGTLGPLVIASSVAATAVTAGSYGAAGRTLTLTVGVDGRLSAVAQPLIALPLSQLNNGTLPSGVKLPAASVNAGSLGATVIASSIAANGVPAGIYGSPTVSAQITVGPDGRLTNVTQFSIPGASTSTAFVDRFNAWTFPQTSASSWTFVNASGIKVNAAVTAGSFIGQGTGITSLTPSAMVTGILPADVIASSVAARKVGDAQLTLSGVTAGTKGSASRSATIVVDAQGRITSLTDNVIAISTGEFVGIVQTAQGGTGQDWSAITVGRIPYFTGTGALGTLAASVNGYSIVQSGGVPAWAAAVSSATNLVGGALGAIPYQSAANTTALLAAGTGVLAESAGAPAWTTAPTLVGTNFSAIPISALTTGGAYPAGSGAAITAITAANISAGTATGLNITGNAATVTTNANLTGNVTSVGNATTIAVIPAVSGALLTNLTAANISAGTAGIDISGNAATATRATNLAGGLLGSLPYQSAVNTSAMLAAGTGVLQETGGAPAWTLVPTLTGTNFTGIPESGVTNLTTDLAAKAALAGATFTGASGITNVAFTATGPNGNIISGSSMTASAFFGDGSHLTGMGSSAFVQMSSQVVTSALSVSVSMPYDDTIPQISEGFEVIVATITPTSAANRLRVRVFGYLTTDNIRNVGMAIFRDATANAKWANAVTTPSAGWNVGIVAEYIELAGSTAKTNFSFRVGQDGAGTVYINGTSTGRKYGGVSNLVMTIEELTP